MHKYSRYFYIFRLVKESRGLDDTMELAQRYKDMAVQASHTLIDKQSNLHLGQNYDVLFRLKNFNV